MMHREQAQPTLSQVKEPVMPLTGKSRDSYLDLELKFPLASIQSERHLAEAIGVMDRLLARGRLDAGAQLYLDALSDLVGLYEDQHHRIPTASAADMLRHLMESRGAAQVDVSRGAKLSKPTVSELLSGKKAFTRQIVQRLAAYFDVDPAILAQCM
jgi:HTH-type transcriptional regulator/antitoxin HigA